MNIAGDAAHYAVTFTDNRITREMLLDLNKEYLNDMGIAMMGDIISILKHAKVVSAQVKTFRMEWVVFKSQRMRTHYTVL